MLMRGLTATGILGDKGVTATGRVKIVFAVWALLPGWACPALGGAKAASPSIVKVSGRTYERQESRANSYVDSAQGNTAVAMYAGGGSVVVWDSRRQEEGTYGVYLQRFSASGQSVGAEVHVNAYTKNMQLAPAVAIDGLGGTWVAWESFGQDGSMSGIVARRFNGDFSQSTDEILVNQQVAGHQSDVVVAADSRGNALFAWTTPCKDGTASRRVVARRFDRHGKPLGDAFAVSESMNGPLPYGRSADLGPLPYGRSADLGPLPYGRSADLGPLPYGRGSDCGRESLPSVAMDGRDRAVLVWSRMDEKGRPAGIRGRVFGMGHFLTGPVRISGGAALTPELAISEPDAAAPGGHIEPSVGATESGFVVAWLTATPNDYVVSARRFTADGTPAAKTQRVSDPSDRYVSGAAVAVATDGRYMVSWNANDKDGSKSGIFARCFDAGGLPLSGCVRVNRHRSGRQRLAAASGKQRTAWGDDDRLVFAWAGDSGLGDKTAANLTLLVPKYDKDHLCPPAVRMKVGMVNKDSRPSRPRETAPKYDKDHFCPPAPRPYEPPTYDPDTIPTEPFGGDPHPFGDGLDEGFLGIINTGWVPPDPHLAAGPDHLVVMTNGAIAFFQKDGVKTFQDEIENSYGFWGAQGATGFVFDPEVLYDPHSDRFMAMACERTDPGGGDRSYFLFAVSDDSDPNGNWHKYRFDVTSPAGGGDIDSPNMAVDAQAIYLSSDHFSPTTFLIYILDKADVLVGNMPTTRSLLITGSQSHGIPVTYDVDAPAQYMIHASEFGTYSSVSLHAITDPLGNPRLASTTVSVPAYEHPEDPPQMGTSVRPELFEARFWSCVYRNGSLWAVHHQNSSRVRATWYEFRMNGWPAGPAPELVQSGDIDPGFPVRTFFPSIWVDDAGNAAITCARSSPSEYISMCRAVRAAGDPPGEFGQLEFVKQSYGPYYSGRWGDYSGTASDPTRLGVFWSYHEYATSGSSWNTWIAEIDMGLCAFKGDVNGDCHIDLNDWAQFEPCLNGPSADSSAACTCFDFDDDQHVDVADCLSFYTDFTGPVATIPACR